MKGVIKTRILLVDDHELVLKGIKSIIENELNLEVLAEAKNGLEAISILQNTTIDLVLTDVKMPLMNGIELTKYVKSNYPNTKVLVLSLFKDREYVSSIIDSEAEGYLLKNADKDEIIFAINHVINDGTFYSQEIVDILKSNSTVRHLGLSLPIILSKREIEIIKLICLEFSSNEIADKLFISKATVDVHRKNIIQKSGVKNIVGLVRFAVQNGIVNEL